MDHLHVTKLKVGEKILFGPARRADQTRLKVRADDDPQRSTYTIYRTVCITNQRVIIEMGDTNITLPNKDIQIVHIKQMEDKRNGHKRFNILQVNSSNGNQVVLNIPGVNTDKAQLLKQTFPNATITDSRGVKGWLMRKFGT